MLKCLIVDDEMISREGVFEAIDWQSLDIEVIGLAKNGEEGLKIFNEQQPDIVISDVKMPVMDGLAMIEAIYAVAPTTQIILISAYSEFSYAQQAIRFGVKNYLLKPVDDDELLAAVSELATERKQALLHKNDGRLRQLMESGHYDTKEGRGTVCLIQADKQATVGESLANGIYRGRKLEICVLHKNDWPAFLAQQTEGYISDFSVEGNLSQNYQEASTASHNGKFWQISGLSWVSLVQQRRKWASSQVMRWQALENLVKEYPNDDTNFFLRADNFLRMLSQYQGVDGDEIWRYCYEVFIQLEERFFILGNEANKLKVKDRLSQAETFSDLKQIFQRLMKEFRVQSSLDSDNELISRIKRLVNERYAEDISSKSLAEEVFLSPNYMGKLFRDLTGFYLNDYILDVRMRQAKRILAKSDAPIADVAAQVGISSSSYFTSLFKKHFQQTPKEFRRIVRNLEN